MLISLGDGPARMETSKNWKLLPLEKPEDKKYPKRRLLFARAQGASGSYVVWTLDSCAAKKKNIVKWYVWFVETGYLPQCLVSGVTAESTSTQLGSPMGYKGTWRAKMKLFLWKKSSCQNINAAPKKKSLRGICGLLEGVLMMILANEMIWYHERTNGI